MALKKDGPRGTSRQNRVHEITEAQKHPPQAPVTLNPATIQKRDDARRYRLKHAYRWVLMEDFKQTDRGSEPHQGVWN